MDDLNLLRDLGRDLEHEPPPTLVRQRSRLAGGAAAPRRRRWLAPAIMATAAAVTAALVLVPTVLLRGGDGGRHALGTVARTESGPARAVNVLVIGADGRNGGASNADSIVLVHLPADRGRASVLSIPRDVVSSPVTCPNAKLASPRMTYMLTGGLSCSVKRVESLTSVRVDQAVKVDFAGFAKMVDALGGVEITLPKAVDDRNSGLRLGAGRHLVKGRQALAYARVRHGLDDGSDLARVERQQRLMKALLARAHQKFGNPVAMARFVAAASSSVTVLGGDDSVALKSLAKGLEKVNPNRSDYAVLPTRINPADPGTLVVDEARTAAALRPFKR
ncbi:LCP family protein [Actinomadura atramentaria]|uniref:LCP family protein n=1 Tax=Actinomadura atramentaria TaxID=1990 RepID=UPI00037EB498|nr:LCP family protein [Actinomadura atramentaria]